jgi:hypothetical protein
MISQNDSSRIHTKSHIGNKQFLYSGINFRIVALVIRIVKQVGSGRAYF